MLNKISPTSIEMDWDCGMKRFYHKEMGIAAVEEASYFREGRQIHSDLADIARGKPLSEVLDGLDDSAPPTSEAASADLEVLTRRAGIVTAFSLYIWPLWAAEYDVVMVEKYLTLTRGSLEVECIEDLVLRRRSNGELVVKDYKTAKMIGKEWINHWPYAMQMHICIKAVEEELKEPVKYAHIVGIPKGYTAKGLLRHPYVYAYSDGADFWSPDWTKNCALRGTWEYPGGVAAWVAHLGPDQAYELFPCSMPIVFNQRLFDRLIYQRMKREELIAANREQCKTDIDLRESIFEQRFSKCRPSFGSACEFLAACHNAEVNRDPIGSGLYITREKA